MSSGAASLSVGKRYSRAEIGAALGGSNRACLVTGCGQVVAVCFQPEMNPRGPEVIYVGMGKIKERAAASLAKQSAAVPVFQKDAAKAWRYLGLFTGVSYSEDGRDIAVANKETGRDHVAGILHLRAAK